MRNTGAICGCGNCVKAGVETEPMRWIPDGKDQGHWAHGEELRGWLSAARRFDREMKALAKRLHLDPEKLKNAGGGR